MIQLESADKLLVNLFIPSQLHWADRGVTLTQETRLPAEPGTRLRGHECEALAQSGVIALASCAGAAATLCQQTVPDTSWDVKSDAVLKFTWSANDKTSDPGGRCSPTQTIKGGGSEPK